MRRCFRRHAFMVGVDGSFPSAMGPFDVHPYQPFPAVDQLPAPPAPPRTPTPPSAPSPPTTPGQPAGPSPFQPPPSLPPLNSEQIQASQSNSVGGLFFTLPGATSAGLAPGTQRPVLRGLDDFRVRVQENGVGSLDVSDYGQDHGVPLHPLAIQKAQILRRPQPPPSRPLPARPPPSPHRRSTASSRPPRSIPREKRSAAPTCSTAAMRARRSPASARSILFPPWPARSPPPASRSSRSDTPAGASFGRRTRPST